MSLNPALLTTTARPTNLIGVATFAPKQKVYQLRCFMQIYGVYKEYFSNLVSRVIVWYKSWGPKQKHKRFVKYLQ